MTPAPYCLACNRLHLPGRCRCSDRMVTLLGLFLLMVAEAIIGVALAGLSVGAW